MFSIAWSDLHYHKWQLEIKHYQMANMPADLEIVPFPRSPTLPKFGGLGQSLYRLEPRFEYELTVFLSSRIYDNFEKYPTDPRSPLLTFLACYQCQFYSKNRSKNESCCYVTAILLLDNQKVVCWAQRFYVAQAPVNLNCILIKCSLMPTIL